MEYISTILCITLRMFSDISFWYTAQVISHIFSFHLKVACLLRIRKSYTF